MSSWLAAVLQYAGLLLAGLFGWLQYRALVGEGSAPSALHWVLAAVMLAAGTILRLTARRSPPPSENVRDAPLPNGLHAAAITPAMYSELRGTGMWVRTFAWIVAAFGTLMFLGAIAGGIGAFTSSGRVEMLMYWAMALFYILMASLYWMLSTYANDHARKIAAARAPLTESQFAAIVDSQRRVFRYFGTMLGLASVAMAVILLAGVYFGLRRVL